MYWEVSKEEMHKVINEHLDDIDKIFANIFQKVLSNPKKFGLKID